MEKRIETTPFLNQYFPSVEVWQRNEEHPENPNVWLYRRYYGPDETVRLTSLNLQLTMADIYQDLHFEQKEAEDDET
ncbi:MAG TPA: hypothetical protein VN729_04720 [Ktedonobacteraceae bacterium]|nr:hypothetical protein [Ktedonobacteraceae bacterium]